MAAGLTEVLWVSEERSGLHVKFQDRQGSHQAATSDLLIRTQESASVSFVASEVGVVESPPLTACCEWTDLQTGENSVYVMFTFQKGIV